MDLGRARKDSKYNDTASAPVLKKLNTSDLTFEEVLMAQHESESSSAVRSPIDTSEEECADVYSPLAQYDSTEVNASLLSKQFRKVRFDFSGSAPAAPAVNFDNQTPKRPRSSSTNEADRPVKLTTARRQLMGLAPLTPVRFVLPRAGSTMPVDIPTRTLRNAPERPANTEPSNVPPPLISDSSPTTLTGRHIISRPTSPYQMMFTLSCDSNWNLPIESQVIVEEDDVNMHNTNKDADDECPGVNGAVGGRNTVDPGYDSEAEDRDQRARLWFPRYAHDHQDFPARWVRHGQWSDEEEDDGDDDKQMEDDV